MFGQRRVSASAAGSRPTAVQSDALTHETANRLLPAAGCGMDCTVQPDGLRVSDSNCAVGDEMSPTAMQMCGEVQETAVSSQISEPRFAVVCCCQLAKAAVGAATSSPEATTEATSASLGSRIEINSSND